MNSNESSAPAPLLECDEPPAVEVVNGRGGGSVVLLCDHATNLVPRRLGTLGLTPAQLAEHIGWDLGAAAVARCLSPLLDAPLVLSGYSRLVIDCNRSPGSPESIPAVSAGVAIPGNDALTTTNRDGRINELFRPYHAAIARLLESRAQRPTLLVSIHSFTPILEGRQRPWQIGVCYGHDRRLAALMLGELMRSADIVIGDNEPYSIEEEVDHTIPTHGEGRGLPCVMIEIRQDGIRTPDAAALWAERLARCLLAIEAEALRLALCRKN